MTQKSERPDFMCWMKQTNRDNRRQTSVKSTQSWYYCLHYHWTIRYFLTTTLTCWTWPGRSVTVLHVCSLFKRRVSRTTVRLARNQQRHIVQVENDTINDDRKRRMQINKRETNVQHTHKHTGSKVNNNNKRSVAKNEVKKNNSSLFDGLIATSSRQPRLFLAKYQAKRNKNQDDRLQSNVRSWKNSRTFIYFLFPFFHQWWREIESDSDYSYWQQALFVSLSETNSFPLYDYDPREKTATRVRRTKSIGPLICPLGKDCDSRSFFLA